MKTRLNNNIYINPVKSEQYNGEIAESLVFDFNTLIDSSKI